MEDFPAPGIPTSITERRAAAGPSSGASANGRSRTASPSGAAGAVQAAAVAVLRDTAAEASTPRPGSEYPHKPMLHRPAVLAALVLLGLVLAGLLYLGAFPPEVTPSTVERPVPNDRFQPR